MRWLIPGISLQFPQVKPTYLFQNNTHLSHSTEQNKFHLRAFSLFGRVLEIFWQ